MWTRLNGVFTLPNSDSCTDSEWIEFSDNVHECFHWTYTNPIFNSYSDSKGYCSQFGTDISTNTVEFNYDFASESP